MGECVAGQWSQDAGQFLGQGIDWQADSGHNWVEGDSFFMDFWQTINLQGVEWQGARYNC